MIDVRKVAVGAKLKLVGGGMAEVVENMDDGMWLMVRYTDLPSDPALVGTEELCHAQDIVEVT